jgi:hypothetical protein
MTNLSLSPPQMSDAAPDDDACLQYEAEPDERFTSLKCNLAQHCNDTNDMFSTIQTSIAAFTAAQSTPKRAKLPETPKTTPVATPTKNHLRPGLPSDFVRQQQSQGTQLPQVLLAVHEPVQRRFCRQLGQDPLGLVLHEKRTCQRIHKQSCRVC